MNNSIIKNSQKLKGKRAKNLVKKMRKINKNTNTHKTHSIEDKEARVRNYTDM